VAAAPARPPTSTEASAAAKSHFMAILHLILSGNSHARSIPELADVIAKHMDWMEEKKILMVPDHLMNARWTEKGSSTNI